ncbi:putative quinol monooxygenase [Streptomyces cavernae]|uniref:putative quinol monooxygenase n=1 Tax=Streptomyces cavernae TaxID=2259034 RepID=UPI00192E6363|nr:putative quinol monooxygenase [Streptomyces cavernae]
MAGQIIVSGWMDYEPVDRDTMLGYLIELGRRTREAEPGCLDYAMTADPADAGRIRVYERWASQRALDEHFTTAHIKEFRGAVSGLVRVGVSLQAHTVAESRDMR